jgi:hypothetical protein
MLVNVINVGKSVTYCLCLLRSQLLIIFSVSFKFLNLREPSVAIWLQYLERNSQLEEFFTNTDITFEGEFLVAQEDDDHTVVLREIYRVSPSFSMHIHHFGVWTSLRGLTLSTVSFYERRSNLQGHLFRTICPEVGQFARKFSRLFVK